MAAAPAATREAQDVCDRRRRQRELPVDMAGGRWEWLCRRTSSWSRPGPAWVSWRKQLHFSASQSRPRMTPTSWMGCESLEMCLESSELSVRHEAAAIPGRPKMS